MSATTTPVQSRLAGEPLLADVIAEVCRHVASRSAILEKLAWAWSEFDPGGTNNEMDRDFWRGVEDLMRANRQDVARLEALSDGGAQ